MLPHLPVSHSIFHLTAPASVRHEVAAAPYPVMGTPTKARKSKAGTLPEDSKVRDLLGTGREKRTISRIPGKGAVLHSWDWWAGWWGARTAGWGVHREAVQQVRR